MTNSNITTIREKLGLSIESVAKLTGFSVRTISKYEAGELTINKEVFDTLEKIEKTADRLLYYIIEIIDQLKHDVSEYDECVHLIRFTNNEDFWFFYHEFKNYPYSFHSSIILRIIQHLETRNINYKVVYMDKEKYLNWLGAQQDSEYLRLLWALKN